MTTQSFEELIALKRPLTTLLDKLGLQLHKSNRWSVAFDLVEKLNEARLAGTIEEISAVELGTMRFALLDLSELGTILESLTEDDDAEILRLKFNLLMSGSPDRTKESDVNSVARDTQLELVLNARFRKAGLKSKLCEPHPDIVIEMDDRSYGVECKRVFSQNTNAVKRNVEKAATQLRDHYLNTDKHGFVAIGVERHLTGGDKILQSKSELSARVFLSNEVEVFCNSYGPRWSNQTTMKDERVAGILVYMSFAGLVEDEGIPIHATQVGVTNCYWTPYSRINFNLLEKDIAVPMLADAGEMNEYVRVISDAAKQGNA